MDRWNRTGAYADEHGTGEQLWVRRVPTQPTAELLRALTSLVIKHLDLVVTVLIALAHVTFSRRLLDHDNSPWYLTARLFRQTCPADWSGVFERIAGAVRERMVTTSQVRYAV